MNGFRAALTRHFDDLLAAQIALSRRGWSDLVCFVGLAHMPRGPISLGIHRYGCDTHLAAGRHNTYRDLAAIGNKNFFKHYPFPTLPLQPRLVCVFPDRLSIPPVPLRSHAGERWFR